MSTSVAFTPSTAAVFQFSATLDGDSYTLSVPWGVAGQRWYLQIVDSQGTLILYRALISSPQTIVAAGGGVNLLFGYFVTSTLVFVDETQTFIVGP